MLNSSKREAGRRPMARSALTIREMGEQVCWMLIQQALGIPDAKMQSDFMQNRVALMLFARHSLPERLCVTAAVRQMGGSTIYQGSQGAEWQAECRSFQTHMFPILGYFLDCLYIYGFPAVEGTNAGSGFPVINAGSPAAHPAHALADIACMLRVAKDLEGVKAAWIGCANGTLHSLIEASAWCPFSLTVSLPPETDAAPLKLRVAQLRSQVRFVDTPEEAVAKARFIYAGRKPEKDSSGLWAITKPLMSKADIEARLLLSATPVRAIQVDPEILDSKASMLVRQAQYRLCVHKRILHWVFDLEE